MKTYKEWEDTELDLTDFIKPGDEIDEEIYTHIGYALVGPHYDDGVVLQCGECSFVKDGVDHYMTAIIKNNRYFYLGELPSKHTPKKKIRLPSPRIKRK